MSVTAETVQLVKGRGGIDIPKMTFDETMQATDVSQFFRALWVANQERNLLPLAHQYTVDNVGPFNGENALGMSEQATDFYIPASGSKNWSLLTYRYRDLRHTSPYRHRIEEHTISVAPATPGYLAVYLTARHYIGTELLPEPVEKFDELHLDYIGGSLSFTMRNGAEHAHMNSHHDQPATLVMANVMNACFEYLRP